LPFRRPRQGGQPCHHLTLSRFPLPARPAGALFGGGRTDSHNRTGQVSNGTLQVDQHRLHTVLERHVREHLAEVRQALR
jgi:hypothetical protein